MSGERVVLGGTLRRHLGSAVDQLSASTPYAVPLVVQDVRWDPDRTRLFQDYRGDLSGRYLRAVGDAVRQDLPVDPAKASEVLTEILGCQNPDGTFGPTGPAQHLDHGAAWGHGLLLAGLLAAGDWAPDKHAPDVARATERLATAISGRAASWAAALAGSAELQKFALDPLSAVLPLVRHAAATGSERSLAAARTLAGALPTDRSGVHMHGYLLALRGLLELAVLTGDTDLRAIVRADVEAVAAEFRLPHGGVLESLSTPWDVNTEGCGTADWIMLNLRLFELDPDARLIGEAALSTFNALLHSQHPSGHFGCETLSREPGLLMADYAPEAWWCCTFHGIQALAVLADHVLTLDDDGVAVELPVPATLLSAAEDAVVTVAGDYPYGDRIRVEAGPAFPAGAPVRLRVPATASVRELELDGRALEVDASDGWVRVPAVRPGARIDLVLRQHEWFDLDGLVGIPPFGNTTVGRPDLAGTRSALFRGPLLLAANADDNAPADLLRARRLLVTDAGELSREDRTALVTARGYDTFRQVLRLAPLAGDDLERNPRLTRIYFEGLLQSDTSLHG